MLRAQQHADLMRLLPRTKAPTSSITLEELRQQASELKLMEQTQSDMKASADRPPLSVTLLSASGANRSGRGDR